MANMLAQELGILFGFVAVFLLSMAAYAVVWRLGQRRSEKKELERRQVLTEQGIGEKAVVDRDNNV
ncbi:MAG: hypothetical protein M1833_006858 [Piccolia ochrophora]|nr:MAG: hypothetical protein M1833_006858 [Piccolia ochrophora]